MWFVLEEMLLMPGFDLKKSNIEVQFAGYVLKLDFLAHVAARVGDYLAIATCAVIAITFDNVMSSEKQPFS